MRAWCIGISHFSVLVKHIPLTLPIHEIRANGEKTLTPAGAVKYSSNTECKLHNKFRGVAYGNLIDKMT